MKIIMAMFVATAFSVGAAQLSGLSGVRYLGDDAWSYVADEYQVGGDADAKVVWEKPNLDDFEMEMDVLIEAPNGQAGFVFRGVIRNGQYQGYYVGLHAGANFALWGAFDPKWNDIARKSVEVRSDAWYHMRLQVRGDNVKMWVDGIPVGEGSFPRVDGIDARFSRGMIGLRKLGGGARFKNVIVRAVPPEPAGPTYTNPVSAVGADPVVFLYKGTYYAYCTYSPDFPDMPRGIRLYKSKDLVNWTDEGFVLKNKDSWGESRFWAPDIVEKDGVFYLYYAADTRICVATAKSPDGPFKQEVKKPMEPDSIRIDAHIFEDDDGQRYIYYVGFNQGNEIWGGRLNDDMVSVDESSLRLMVRPDQAWERHQAPITEGPEMIKHAGVYYLTYSGSHFENPNYGVGYATSDSPLGPWKKYEHNPIMKSTEYAHGTAHHCLTTSPDGKEIFIVYHRHHDLSTVEPRQLSIDRVQFVPCEDGPAILQIHGPTSSPQPMPSGVGSR